MLVFAGSGYSTISPVLELIRAMRSDAMPPVQMSPFLSTLAW